MAAVKATCGAVGGVRIYPDGGFAVLAPGEIQRLEDDAESAKVAERIRNAGCKTGEGLSIS